MQLIRRIRLHFKSFWFSSYQHYDNLWMIHTSTKSVCHIHTSIAISIFWLLNQCVVFAIYILRNPFRLIRLYDKKLELSIGIPFLDNHGVFLYSPIICCEYSVTAIIPGPQYMYMVKHSSSYKSNYGEMSWLDPRTRGSLSLPWPRYINPHLLTYVYTMRRLWIQHHA